MTASSASSINAPAPDQHRTARFALFALFLASGFAGLVYQVVWSRLLTYRFGATLDAVTTILVAFMGGLALGSWLLGRQADRMNRPLWLYGVLEIGIGLSAAVMPLLLDLLVPVYRAVVASNPDAIHLHRAIRFLLTGILILAPTTAMGATLPALSKFLTHKAERLGLNVGGLYALNTTGAVLGALCAGFFMILLLGVKGALLVAVFLNLLVGGVAIWLSRSLEEGSATEETPKESLLRSQKEQGAARIIIWVYGVSGLLALAYQVVWFRALVFNFEFLKNTTYSFSAMLTVFLAGIALGSAVMTRFVDKLKEPFLIFALLEVLIGIFGLFSFFVIRSNLGEFVSAQVDDAGGVSWLVLVSVLFSKTSLAIFPPTFAMGLLFPVAVRCYVESLDHLAADVGRLYAANTLGAIIGAGVTSFFVVPAIGIGWTIVLLSSTSVLLGVVVLLAALDAPFAKRGLLAGLSIGLLAVLVMRGFPKEFPIQMQKVAPVIETSVFYADGPLGTISVIENSKKERTIYVDNVGVAGTDPILLTDQKSLAHVPMVFHPNPERVLTVGFGSGGASYSYCTYPMLKEVHCVEIDPTVLRAAHTLTASNHGLLMPKFRKPDGSTYIYTPRKVRDRMERHGREYLEAPFTAVKGWIGAYNDSIFEAAEERGEEFVSFHTFDERYKLILDDARSYLQNTAVKYDVIATDCTDLRYKTNANLYDLEYFTICRESLTDDGLVVVWMPMAGLSRDLYQVALRTFAEVFPDMSVWYMNNEPTHYCLLIGTKSGLKIDVPRMRERLAIPEVQEDLYELRLHTAEKILSTYLTDTRDLDLGDGTDLNTENYPVLEFLSPRFGYGDEPLLTNLDYMAEYRNDVVTYVSGGTEEEMAELVATLDRYEAAELHILAGHAAYRRIDTEEACRQYMKAAELTPDDEAVEKLLNFEELRLLADNRNEAFYSLILANVYEMQDRHNEAMIYLSKIINRGVPARPADRNPAVQENWVRMISDYNKALDLAAKISRKTGDTVQAEALLRQKRDVPGS
jgi:spermidine synthase